MLALMILIISMREICTSTNHPISCNDNWWQLYFYQAIIWNLLAILYFCWSSLYNRSFKICARKFKFIHSHKETRLYESLSDRWLDAINHLVVDYLVQIQMQDKTDIFPASPSHFWISVFPPTTAILPIHIAICICWRITHTSTQKSAQYQAICIGRKACGNNKYMVKRIKSVLK